MGFILNYKELGIQSMYIKNGICNVHTYPFYSFAFAHELNIHLRFSCSYDCFVNCFAQHANLNIISCQASLGGVIWKNSAGLTAAEVSNWSDTSHTGKYQWNTDSK